MSTRGATPPTFVFVPPDDRVNLLPTDPYHQRISLISRGSWRLLSSGTGFVNIILFFRVLRMVGEVEILFPEQTHPIMI